MKPYEWRKAITKSGLKSTTRHVLLTMATYWNDGDDYVFPSTKTLSDDTGLSERAVITHIHEAAEAGWIKVNKLGANGQAWARNCYQPSIPEGFSIIKGTEPASAPLDEKASQEATKGTERPSAPNETNEAKALNDVPKALNDVPKALNVVPKALNVTQKALNDVQSNKPLEESKEESKEETKEETKERRARERPAPFSLPDWIPLPAWNAYIDMRREKKKYPTDYARDLVIKELEKLLAAGHDLEKVLNNSIKNGWTDVYGNKSTMNTQQAAGSTQLGKAGQATAQAAQRFLEKRNASGR